jgi:hypothetical protein
VANTAVRARKSEGDTALLNLAQEWEKQLEYLFLAAHRCGLTWQLDRFHFESDLASEKKLSNRGDFSVSTD